MFTCVAGKVMFTHKMHADESGYGIACADCHHHPSDDESALRACGDCHNLPEDGTAPAACADCHEPDEYEVESLIKRSDAFHSQCIGCHKDNDAGPQECSACHVL